MYPEALKATRALALLAALFQCLAPARAADFSKVVADARAESLHPQDRPPEWLDWTRVQDGLLFFKTHSRLLRIWGTTSLAETYAAKDIAPVLMKTRRLIDDPDQRLQETGVWVLRMVQSQPAQNQFAQHNYRRAYELGRLHAGLGESITAKSLGWDPSVRVPFNQQASALVLYTFAWEPVEEMLSSGQLNVERDAATIDDYLHLWSVLGYAMGVREDLLPRDYARAKALAPALRQAQYAGPQEKPDADIPALLTGLMKTMLPDREAGQKIDSAQARREVAQALADAIFRSPGLTQALGLGDRPVDRLTELAAGAVP